MNPIITLTSDFGLADHYVGAMKGVISRICPNAKVIDITHEIPLFNVYAGAYAISQAAPYFPAEAVHVRCCRPGRRHIPTRHRIPESGGRHIHRSR